LMKSSSFRTVARIALATGCLLAGIGDASAQSGLTTLDGPQGGKVVFGQVVGRTTIPSALAAVLQSVHGNFGVKPEIGRVFSAAGDGSAAVYFTVAPQGRPSVAGMAIVAPDGKGGFEGGVVFDDPQRIQTSFSPMLQKLFASWPVGGSGPGNAAAGGGSPGPSAGPAPLRQFVLPDRSAAAGVPEGWQVAQGSGGGTILINGPRGELVALGYPFLVMDTASANGRRIQQQATNGPLRNTSYAQNLFYPFGGPLGKTFVDLLNMDRARHGQQPAQMRIVSEEPSVSQGNARCTHLRGQAESDGKGPMAFDTTFCVSPPGAASLWMAYANYAAVPMAMVTAEAATVVAILTSFRTDEAVIQRQANAIAAPVIAQIHEIGRQATLRAAEADRTRLAMRQSYEAHSESLDRQSKAFSDYMRDTRVVVDRDTGTHTTEWNRHADSLVETNPQRYGYVDTKDFWKGVDY
jgi:hypothetical protein